MKAPAFSIITVTYNAKKMLERTLLSVVNQTYRNIEYIIIDGASKDGTVKIIRCFESGLSHWVSEPDKGIYDAMNKGLMAATGDYVWFVNAGDAIKHNEIVMELSEIAIQKGLPDVLYGETDLIDSAGNLFAKRRLKAPKRLTWKSFRMGMLVSHQAFIVKREIAPHYDLKYRFSADFDWCIQCLKKARTITNSNIRLIHYQYEGTTTANRKVSLKERYEIMCKNYGILSTQIRHLWFAIRFYWAKFIKNNS
jgi:glycosyltransferase involved in cell wall biosynthesis